MPQAPVAWAKVYNVGDGPFQHDITSLEDAEDRMRFDSGDLSSIEDYEIRYIVTRYYQRPGIVGFVTHTRVKVARPWASEDSEFEFEDRMYPSEDF
jgi:hypothetical protein